MLGFKGIVGGFLEFRAKTLKSKWVWFKQKWCNKITIYSQMHDPSSHPRQLVCKNARKIKIKTQNPKLLTIGENFKKSHTLGLIQNVSLESFWNHRDLAKNPFESVWVREKWEKMGMNRVWGRSTVFIKRCVNSLRPITGVYLRLTLIFFLLLFFVESF
jgi:hypothetical protein